MTSNIVAGTNSSSKSSCLSLVFTSFQIVWHFPCRSGYCMYLNNVGHGRHWGGLGPVRCWNFELDPLGLDQLINCAIEPGHPLAPLVEEFITIQTSGTFCTAYMVIQDELLPFLFSVFVFRTYRVRYRYSWQSWQSPTVISSLWSWYLSLRKHLDPDWKQQRKLENGSHPWNHSFPQNFV